MWSYDAMKDILVKEFRKVSRKALQNIHRKLTFLVKLLLLILLVILVDTVSTTSDSYVIQWSY